jgi:hypothetical protein
MPYIEVLKGCVISKGTLVKGDKKEISDADYQLIKPLGFIVDSVKPAPKKKTKKDA